MSEKRKRPRVALRYVEDYIEEFLHTIATQPKLKVEIKVEEEKTESLRIRVITTSPDGKKAESVSESPKLFLVDMPNLEQVEVKSPPQNAQLELTLGSEISAEMRLPLLTKVVLPCNLSILTMTIVKPKIGRLLPLNLPYVLWGNFYAWFKDANKPVSFPRQTNISAFTLKHLLRLVEIPLKFPVTSEVKASVKLPILVVEKFLVQQTINARLTEAIKTLQDMAQAQQLKQQTANNKQQIIHRSSSWKNSTKPKAISIFLPYEPNGRISTSMLPPEICSKRMKAIFLI